MSAIDLRDLCLGLFGKAEGGELFAVIFAYLDESGTDLASVRNHVVIAGFFAPLDLWLPVMRDFNAEIDRVGVKPFHRVHCNSRRKLYYGWTEKQAKDHINNLSRVVGLSQVQSVVASFDGEWASMGLSPQLQARYPHPYHHCFEQVMDEIVRRASFFGEDRIAVIMERQDEFSVRAQQIYDLYQYNGKWGEINHFSYADKNSCPYLQTADLLAWEIRRSLSNLSRNIRDTAEYPLINRIMGRPNFKEDDLGRVLNEAALRNVFSKPEGVINMPPGFKWS